MFQYLEFHDLTFNFTVLLYNIYAHVPKDNKKKKWQKFTYHEIKMFQNCYIFSRLNIQFHSSIHPNTMYKQNIRLLFP